MPKRATRLKKAGVLAVANRLTGMPSVLGLVEPHRTLEAQGTLQVYRDGASAPSTELILVFNDLVLCTSPEKVDGATRHHGHGTGALEFLEWIELSNKPEAVVIPAPEEGEVMVQLTSCCSRRVWMFSSIGMDETSRVTARAVATAAATQAVPGHADRMVNSWDRLRRGTRLGNLRLRFVARTGEERPSFEEGDDWVTCWFVLKGALLYFYDHPHGHVTPRGVLPLLGCSVYRVNANAPHAFVISHARRRYYVLAAASDLEAKCWVETLELVTSKVEERAVSAAAAAAAQDPPDESLPAQQPRLSMATLPFTHEFVLRETFHLTRGCFVCSETLRGKEFFKCAACKKIVHTWCINGMVDGTCQGAPWVPPPARDWTEEDSLVANMRSSDADGEIARRACKDLVDACVSRGEDWVSGACGRGAADALVSLMDPSAPTASQTIAAKAVQAMSLYQAGKNAVVKAGAVKVILGLLRSHDKTLNRDSAGAVWALANGNSQIDVLASDIVATGCVAALVALVSGGSGYEVRINAMGALTALCLALQAAEDTVKQGFRFLVAALAESGSPQLQQKSAELVIMLCQHPGVAAKLVDGGVGVALKAVVSWGRDLKARRAATEAMATLDRASKA